jgi:hypothetical protein
MHHTAQLGEPPVELEFPLPEMRLRTSVRLAAARHWAAPVRDPASHIEVHDYDQPEEPKTLKEKLIKGAHLAIFLW